MKTFNGVVMALAVCAIAGFGAPGCNTFRGVGMDAQLGGRAVENAADNGENGQQNQHQRQNTIMAVSDSGGLLSPSGGTNVPHGSSQTFLIEPNNGNRVLDVFVDGRSVGPVERYTFDHVTSSHTISALFCADSNG